MPFINKTAKSVQNEPYPWEKEACFVVLSVHLWCTSNKSII